MLSTFTQLFLIGTHLIGMRYNTMYKIIQERMRTLSFTELTLLAEVHSGEMQPKQDFNPGAMVPRPVFFPAHH